MADAKKYISKINIGAGVYDVKDTEARNDIAEIQDTLSGSYIDDRGHLILGTLK